MKIAVNVDGKYYEGVLKGLDFKPVFEQDFRELYESNIRFTYGVELTEDILKSFNIPNLGLIKTMNGFKIFDTDVEEYIENKLPVYIENNDKLVDNNMTVVLKRPTRKALKASENMYCKVRRKFMEILENRKEDFVKKALEKGKGITYVKAEDGVMLNILWRLQEKGLKILFQRNATHYIIGNVAKHPELELYVPKEVAELLKEEDVSKFAKEINAKNITLKTI